MLQFGAARRVSLICRALAALCGIALAAGIVHAQSSSRADPARGEARAAACGACHGSPQSALLPGMPALAGQQEQFLVLQMILLREGLRDVPQMAGMLNGLSDRDLGDIAAYFARQPLRPQSGGRDAGLHARGAELARSMGCGSCHLQDYSGQQQVPRLLNQQEDYLAAAMKAYRDNKRTGIDTSMNAVLYQVPDSDIQALAHYLAHQ